MRKVLTAAVIVGLKPPPSGQVCHFDQHFPALALRITAKGVKSWVFYARLHGRLRMVTLGRYPVMSLHAARLAAGAVAAKFEAGIDVVAERRAKREAPVDALAPLVAEWLRRAQGANRSRAKIERMFAREILPVWGTRPVASITGREIGALIDRIVDRGTIQAAREVQARLTNFFRWCVNHHRIDRSPVAGLAKPGKPASRARVLTDDELRRIWLATDDPALGAAYVTAIKILCLTAARRSEVSFLTWDEVNFASATIELPPARTKTGTPRTIALSPPAVELLRAQPRTPDQPFVFVGAAGRPLNSWSKVKRKLGGLAGVEDWVVHDIRRSVATNLQKLGTKLEVIETCLGHAKGSRSGIIAVYQRHQFTVEARRALETWAIELDRIVSGAEADTNVIALRQPAAP